MLTHTEFNEGTRESLAWGLRVCPGRKLKAPVTGSPMSFGPFIYKKLASFDEFRVLDSLFIFFGFLSAQNQPHIAIVTKTLLGPGCAWEAETALFKALAPTSLSNLI